MINIAKKKLPKAALSVLVYLSYCAMGFFVMRGSMAYYGQYYGLPKWFTNDIWSFFLGGLVPFALYELISVFGFKMIWVRAGGDLASVKYGLGLTVIAANVFLALFKLIYLAIPLYASIINVIIDPVITLAFVALYLLYAFKQEYVEKSRFRIVLTQVMSIFLAVYGVLALLNIVLAVA